MEDLEQLIEIRNLFEEVTRTLDVMINLIQKEVDGEEVNEEELAKQLGMFAYKIAKLKKVLK